MKNFLLLILILAGILSSFAQNNSKNDSPDSPALKEATKASLEVVKLFQQKKYSEALPFAQKALEVRVRELGKDHLSVAQAWRNLAFVQSQLGKKKEAENSFDKAFDVYEKNQPLSASDEKMFAELLQTVAVNEANDGNLLKAEKKLIRAVTLSEKLSGVDALETANVLLTLSELYQAIGEYSKANPLLQRSFEIKNSKMGTTNEQTKEVYRNLSCNLIKLKKTPELEALQNKFYPDDIDKDAKAIQSGVVNGKALNLVKPRYPAEARMNRISGKVEVKVTIDETGSVIHACAESGAKELQRTSEIASYQSKFSPTTVQGKAVKVTGTILYNFSAR